jgi:hypothetical protein
MKRRGLIAFVAVAFALAAAPREARALSAQDLVGTWTPVSVPTYDPNPKGLLTFAANGRVSVILLRADLPKYASNNRLKGTPEEYKATGQGALCYYGTYALRGTDLILHIEGSSFPNWTGADQKRSNLTLADDKLSWTNPAPSAGGTAARVVWQRAK